MLKLLQSIFGTEKQGKYPESLVKEAVERAVDATDPALRRTLLQSKLNLLQREGWGFDATGGSEALTVAAVEEKLAGIEAQLQELGGTYDENEAYLQSVAELLGKPEEYFLGKIETIFVNRMGFKQNEASSDAPAVDFSELRNAEGRSQAVLLVALPGEELHRLTS